MTSCAVVRMAAHGQVRLIDFFSTAALFTFRRFQRSFAGLQKNSVMEDELPAENPRACGRSVQRIFRPNRSDRVVHRPNLQQPPFRPGKGILRAGHRLLRHTGIAHDGDDSVLPGAIGVTSGRPQPTRLPPLNTIIKTVSTLIVIRICRFIPLFPCNGSTEAIGRLI